MIEENDGLSVSMPASMTSEDTLGATVLANAHLIETQNAQCLLEVSEAEVIRHV
jgi:hypothetical protein